MDTDHLWGAHPGSLHIWSRKEEIRVNNKVPLSTAALREMSGLPVVLRVGVQGPPAQLVVHGHGDQGQHAFDAAERLSMWIGLATGSGATIGSCPSTLRDTYSLAPGLVAGLHDGDLTSPCGFAAHQAISTPFPDHLFSVLADDLSLCVFVAFLSKLGQRF